jgi:hypothetical protein
MSGWLDISAKDNPFSSIYRIKNLQEVRALAIREGDKLNIKGLGEFIVSKVIDTSYIDKDGKREYYFSIRC